MRGLFERLGSDEPSHRDERASVLAHLRVLLNARQGSWQTRPDYGLPDFTDALHDFPSGAHTLQQAVRDAIAEFEPRLTRVQVRVLGVSRRTMSVHLEVRGQLVHREAPPPPAAAQRGRAPGRARPATPPTTQRVRFVTRITRSHVAVDP